MLIQIILVALIALIVFRLSAKLKTREISGKQFAGWLLIWLVAVIVVIWPDLTVKLANAVGVGRGADLVIYVSVIFLFYSLFRLLLRIEKLEKNLTEVVRRDAIDEYDKK
jgi:hypothetical protein